MVYHDRVRYPVLMAACLLIAAAAAAEESVPLPGPGEENPPADFSVPPPDQVPVPPPPPPKAVAEPIAPVAPPPVVAPKPPEHPEDVPPEQAPPPPKIHHDHVEPRKWPGTFVGLRLGYALGNAVVPRFGVQEDRTARVTLSQSAPYLGAELGYAEGKVGGSFTFDGTFLLPTPSHLASPPSHFLVGIQGMYVRNKNLRWILGWNIYSAYRMAFPSGMVATLNGSGARFGAHLRLGRPESPPWEAFAYLSADRFNGVNAGFNKNTQSYSVGDLIGSDGISSLIMLVAGVQFDLAY